MTYNINMSAKRPPTPPCWRCDLAQLHSAPRGLLPLPENPNINRTFVNPVMWQTLFYQLLLCAWDSPFAKDPRIIK